MAQSEQNPPPEPARKRLVYRHFWPVRLTHWINFVVITIMLMSGLQIFNARPGLYWGAATDFDHPLVFFDGTMKNGQPLGVTHIFGEDFDTTGWFGMSRVDGRPTPRAFPAWATIPGHQWLAMGRHWHFFFAWLFVLNGLAYGIYVLVTRHFWREIVPKWRDLKHIGGDTLNHLRLSFPANRKGHYNVLQKITYLIVPFGLGPLIIVTGLTLSPTIDTAFPWLLDIFGGRQTARTIHFITAFTFVGFFVVHIVMVLLSGPINNLRSIITGGFIARSREHDDGR